MSALLTHLPTAPSERTLTLDTSVPEKLTRKQPLFMRSSSLSPTKPIPCQALEANPGGPDPNSTYRRPGIPLWNTNDNKNITHTQCLVKSEPSCSTPHPSKTAPASAHRPRDIRATRLPPQSSNEQRTITRSTKGPPAREDPIVADSAVTAGVCWFADDRAELRKRTSRGVAMRKLAQLLTAHLEVGPTSSCCSSSLSSAAHTSSERRVRRLGASCPSVFCGRPSVRARASARGSGP